MKINLKNSVSLIALQVVFGVCSAQAMFDDNDVPAAAVQGSPRRVIASTKEVKETVPTITTNAALNVSASPSADSGLGSADEPIIVASDTPPVAAPAKIKKTLFGGKKDKSGVENEGPGDSSKGQKHKSPAVVPILTLADGEIRQPSVTRFVKPGEYKLKDLNEKEKAAYDAVKSLKIEDINLKIVGDAMQLQTLAAEVSEENLARAELIRVRTGKYIENKEQLDQAISVQALTNASNLTKDAKKKVVFLEAAQNLREGKGISVEAVKILIKTTEKSKKAQAEKTAEAVKKAK